MSELQWQMSSDLGRIYLTATEKGLSGVFFNKRKVKMADSLEGREPARKYLKQAVRELQEYLEGKRKMFDVPLDARGTDFQKRVWRELSKIPYGQRCSYKDIARKIKNEKAVRAVGRANGLNPLSIIVPCHRVISSSGSLTGYSGGLNRKSKLLDLES